MPVVSEFGHNKEPPCCLSARCRRKFLKHNRNIVSQPASSRYNLGYIFAPRVVSNPFLLLSLDPWRLNKKFVQNWIASCRFEKLLFSILDSMEERQAALAMNCAGSVEDDMYLMLGTLTYFVSLFVANGYPSDESLFFRSSYQCRLYIFPGQEREALVIICTAVDIPDTAAQRWT